MSPPASLLRFNLASPDTGPGERARLAATMRAMVAAADAAGVAEVTVSEHHVTRNRSLSSPIVAAAIALASSRRVPVSISALLLPLYDPVRVALDLAALEEAFPGRLRVVAALGYRPEEYALHGRDFAARGALLDAALATVLATWRSAPTDDVAPVVPASAPARFLAVGGQSRAAARRAVRHGLPFAPRAHLPELEATYRELCEAAGRRPDCWSPAAHFFQVHVAEDPDATWPRVARHYLDDAAEYARWQGDGPRSPVYSAARGAEELRRSGAVRVLTPAACLDLAAAHPGSTLCLHPLAGGMPDDEAWSSVQLFLDHVLPGLAPAPPSPLDRPQETTP